MITRFNFHRTSLALVSLLALPAGLGCRNTAASDETGQIGASVGEVMSSLDESAQGDTTVAMMMPTLPVMRLPAELRPPAWRRALDLVSPTAHAAACREATFSACTSGERTRTFTDCSVGLATLSGTVGLSFSAAPLCALLSAGDSITRTADFTLTGLYGGSLTVSSPGGGQTLTRTAGGFTYAVGGIERVLMGPAGRTLFDISTTTPSPITVTGSSRADLVIVSGSLLVTHHLAGYSVLLTPNNLAWAPSCNCAVSGSLTGSVSGGKHDGKSATVTLTGCGEADVTIDGQTESISLDRCTSI
jgi:hypothetical protein